MAAPAELSIEQFRAEETLRDRTPMPLHSLRPATC
jgi:hypothetical protein